MRVAHVASEVAPLSQTGGLADVAGALGGALERASRAADQDDPVDCAVFSPLYRGVRERADELGVPVEPTGWWVSAELGGMVYNAQLHTVRLPDSAPIHLVDCPALYDRAGLYGEGGGSYTDNPVRFAFLCRAAIQGAAGMMGGLPDVWHAHDWQAGLLPVYLRQTGARGAAVYTIHNLAYQGVTDKHVLPALGLDWSVFTADRMEHFDALNLLKGGVAYADAVTTVSPSYADEILTPAFGCELDGFLRMNAANLTGILNGIDTARWDPASDRAIAARYDVDRWAEPDGKPACRGALLAEMGLWAEPDQIVLGVVSRFADQKGMDLIAELVPELHRLGAVMVVLGSGDPALEDRFRYLAEVFGDHLAVRIEFDPALSHRIYAGADAILIPSRFEPCGLTQLYAMRYGSVPIAHVVGGLRDTVIDPSEGEGATGFCFGEATASGLTWAVERAATMRRKRPDAFAALARAGMERDASWDESARHYLALYRHVAQLG